MFVCAIFKATLCRVEAYVSPLININNICAANSFVGYMTECEFGCQLGYELHGNSKIVCIEEGSVSFSLPTCVGKYELSMIRAISHEIA